MMHFNKQISIIAGTAFLLLTSCSQETDKYDFTKITQRNAFAEPVGEPDATDWMLMEDWSAREKKLFSTYNTYKHPEIANVPMDLLAYPNPAPGLLFFHNPHINLQTKMHVRFVDKKLKVLAKINDIQAYSTSFDLQQRAAGNEYVRMYYMLIRNDSCIAKGHGDIRLK